MRADRAAPIAEGTLNRARHQRPVFSAPSARAWHRERHADPGRRRRHARRRRGQARPRGEGFAVDVALDGTDGALARDGERLRRDRARHHAAGDDGDEVCARLREARQLDADPDAHRQGRRARRGRGARHRRRRLPLQAVLVRRAARPAAGAAAPGRDRAARRCSTAGDLRLDPATHRVLARRRRDRAHPAAVLAARVPHAPRRRGALQGRDPRARLGLRLRRRPQHRRGLRRGSCGCGSTSRSAGGAADRARRRLPARRPTVADRRWAGRDSVRARTTAARDRWCPALALARRRRAAAAHPRPVAARTAGDDLARGRVARPRRPGRGRDGSPHRARRVGDDGVAQVVARDGRVLAASAEHRRRAADHVARTGRPTPTMRVLHGAAGRQRDRELPGLGRARRQRSDGPVTVVAGASLESVGEASRTLRRDLLVGVPLLVLLVAAGTWLVVGRALRPGRGHPRRGRRRSRRRPRPARPGARHRRRDRPAGADHERDARPARGRQPPAARVRRRRLARAAEPAHRAAHPARGRARRTGDARLARDRAAAAGATPTRWSGWCATCSSWPARRRRPPATRATWSTSTTSSSRRPPACGRTTASRSTRRGCRPPRCAATPTSCAGWCATCSRTPCGTPGRGVRVRLRAGRRRRPAGRRRRRPGRSRPADRERVFDRFVALRRGAHPRARGSGLGLAIARAGRAAARRHADGRRLRPRAAPAWCSCVSGVGHCLMPHISLCRPRPRS